VTEITFHFNVPHRLSYSCRLLRKAFLKGASVAVTGDAPTLAELDVGLWSLAPHEFVPHCTPDAAQPTLEMTRIVLTESLNRVDCDEVLINLGQQVPVAFERFERLIEVVSADEADRLAARSRWKHYASRGYVLLRHDFATALD
jgi:DNA polymerase III subunit chi